MAGTINSLGIGSGVLTSDIIDKLKANDEANTITPIKNRMTLSQQKSDSLDLLSSLLTTFKSSVTALNDSALYQNRTVSGNNDGVSVSANTGVAIQSFSISDVNLAKKSVAQSGIFTSTSATVATAEGTLALNIGGVTYEIDTYYDDDNDEATPKVVHTLDSLKTAINEVAGDVVTASILQINKNEYSLVITSKETGADQNISLTEMGAGGTINSNLLGDTLTSGSFTSASDTIATASSSGTMTLNIGGVDYTHSYDDTTTLQNIADAINDGSFDATNDISSKMVAHIVKYGDNDYRLVLTPKSTETLPITLTDSVGGGLEAAMTTTVETDGGLTNIQDASDATFKYNGITLTRSSNTVDDITVGVTINLLQDGASSNIQISQDSSVISEELSALATSYNTLVEQLDKMTLADAENNTVGVFNGDSSISGISRAITQILSSINDEGLSLVQYGIDLSEEGKLSFKESTFTEKMNEDPEAMEKLFAGYTKPDTEDFINGTFTNLSNLLEQYVGYNGSLSILNENYDNEADSLSDEYNRAVELLDKRYETMAARFAAYDSIISKLNNQFTVLQNMITAELNAKD